MPEQAAPRAKHAPRPNRRYLGLMLILLLATALRFYHLDTSSLWSDEGNTWALLTRSFPQIAHDAAADIHPPGYYWLLKVWSMIGGTSAWAMRSFSAVAGLLLVWVIYRLGRYFEEEAREGHVALMAAFLAALNPLQIYYSQEARMYLLLALESALLFWALYALLFSENPHSMPGKGQAYALSRNRSWPFPGILSLLQPALAYVLSGIAGLWTHYSFPIVLAAAGLGFLIHEAPLLINTPKNAAESPTKRKRLRLLGLFSVLNLLIGLAYLPWLPTALDRVLHWPKGGEAIALFDGVRLTIHTLVFGPLRALPAVQWPWLVVAALLPLFALVLGWRQSKRWPLLLWCFAPMLLMFGLGLFSDAFLKFLLTASPAWCLLSAIGVRHLPKPGIWSRLLGMSTVALAALTLPTYYTSPTARDNYAGIAQYLQATAQPAATLVVLDAPGQQEVWHYYQEMYELTLPTVALPQQRPPDITATLNTLGNAVAGRPTVYALFWAMNEADPDRLVERWLDQQAFKGLDSWQGNLRFVTYSLPTNLPCTAFTPPVRFGEAIRLPARCQPAQPAVTAGDVALVGLHWQTLAPLTQRYKVTVQVLDSRNNVIAQRDSEPVGGSLPTDQWSVGQTVLDNHGVLIPPGTPPGTYRLILALYDDNTGERLPLSTTEDFFVLGELSVVRPQRPLPTTLLALQHTSAQKIGPLTLTGYSAYRKGTAHAPDTPIVAGDLVEFTFFWQAPNPLPANWPADLTFTLTLGDQSVTMPLAGDGYPTRQWHAGEQIRSKAELLYTDQGRRPQVTIGEDTRKLQPLSGGPWWQVAW